MQVLRLSSSLGKEEIISESKESAFIAIAPGLAHSTEALELARLLAKRSFKNKTSLAKTFGLEFLLWLSAETDLRKAFKKNDFSNSDFIIVSFRKQDKKRILKKLNAKEKPISLKRKAINSELEKISLARL
ncbi:MAG: hypothetical protein WC488_01330 [Candidatus Micrarchaeia archaeon]